tara:strand:+ start:467 stop:1477 length:1011 start_codon:yes stop_codon:yes gene_type:complete
MGDAGRCVPVPLVPGPLPTDGLQDCLASPSGCLCGEDSPILFNQVDDCEAISESNDFHIVCQSSYQLDAVTGARTPCERLVDDDGETISCTASAGSCIDENNGIAACPICTNICGNSAVPGVDIDGNCCGCPAASVSVHGSNVTVPELADEMTVLRLTYDLPAGYVLSYIGGGESLGLDTSMVVPPGYHVAAPFGATFQTPEPAFFEAMPSAEHDSYFALGDYNHSVWDSSDFLIHVDGTEDWDTGGIVSSSTPYVAGFTPSITIETWNRGAGAVVAQLTIPTTEYDAGCGIDGHPCPTVLLGGRFEPAAGVTSSSDMVQIPDKVEWIRRVTWSYP